MEADDISNYHDVVTAEKAALQKGMNFGVGKKYSIFLMSLRENAPYADARSSGCQRDFLDYPLDNRIPRISVKQNLVNVMPVKIHCDFRRSKSARL